jgi:hypothetical protein
MKGKIFDITALALLKAWKKSISREVKGVGKVQL